MATFPVAENLRYQRRERRIVFLQLPAQVDVIVFTIVQIGRAHV